MSIDTTARTRRRWPVWLAACTAVVVLAVAGVLWLAPSRYLPWDTEAFPEVNAGELTTDQARVVELLRTEHELQRPGTFYAEGIDEAWCADFVSWIMKEAGLPLSNPNSGSWRIPGVYTLQEYYQEQGRYEAVGDYTPSVGDVVLYDNTSWAGQHTNVIVAVEGDEAITVGGNEAGKVRVHTLHYASDSGVVGFGRLQS
ncbi:CHAP domain-containing protein [Rhodococcus sp. SBT000017]|uniref:CHAP domain-containing protein n=1 Tax=Rhodococcus sp. SBT000017 TaxID=1803385 RepID=UPI000EF93A5B|nr:CHAP domain-containing protein [Rhodococcus sp. SBT000017]RMB75586.1 CHAP domain-containing protein [Rhodococcus sp. SBT000017]